MIAMFSIHYILAARWLHLVARCSLAYSSGNLIMTTRESCSSASFGSFEGAELELLCEFSASALLNDPCKHGKREIEGRSE